MLDKQQVKLHFSRNAQSYDNYAVVQKKMATKLAKLLEANNKNPQAILEIGCGTGNYTQILAEKYPQAQILATDISAEMLAITKYKLAAYPNISYQLADGGLRVQGAHRSWRRRAGHGRGCRCLCA